MIYRNLLALAAFFVAGTASAADQTFSAGVGGGNGQCGEFEPEAVIAYDRDSRETPAHVNVRVGPNGSCSGQGVTVDAQAAYNFDLSHGFYATVVGGYDRRTVPFEYDNAGVESFKLFHSVGVETVTAAVGVGYRLPVGTVAVVANAVDNPLADGSNLLPVAVIASVAVFDVEVDATVQAEGIWDVRASRALGRFRAGVSVAHNGHRLDHPAPAVLDGRARLGGPNPTYGFDVTVEM